ncbi:MAG: divergent polysaccharide deacetylase family protein, partial [Spirochaetaceae bacterium]|nr:divergent polysaccharide deacetylase family protein [Spirochaetaceae bacterium]
REPGVPVARVEPSAKPTRPQSGPPAPRPIPPTLVFVIDDAGYNMRELEKFLRLPFPLTIAVLPGLPGSEEAARAIVAAGKELILHQPMAALGGQDPGPGAIGIGQDPAEATRIVAANLRGLTGVSGMNNHMGSAVTTDPDVMGAIAAIAKDRGIYYLDSLTVSGTASAAAARREGIRYWERDVFLDNSPDRASIIRALEEGKKRAARNRPAVMIGHVWSAELAQALSDLYPQLVAEGYSLSTISRYMLEEAAEDDADTRD